MIRSLLRKLAVPCLAGALGLLLLLAGGWGALPAWSADDQLPQLQVIPYINGYPAGRETTLLVLIRPPEGSNLAAPFEMTLDPDQPLQARLRDFSPPPGPAGPAPRLLARLQLKVPATLEPGLHRLKGRFFCNLVDNSSGQQRPARVDFSLPPSVLAAGTKPQELSPQMARALGADKPLASLDDPYAGQSLALTLLLVFLGGLALNLTPCVYPLIPITVSYFGGRAEGQRGALLAHALLYLAGMSLMYSALGSLVALGGGMLGEALTHPLVILGLSGVLVALALSMFGLWEIRLPAALNRLAGASRAGLVGTFLMGLTVGLLAAPCVGPFVVALMTHVGRVGHIWYGMTVFLILSLGLGLPLTVLAIFSGSINRLPGAGSWMIWVRRLFGLVLLVMALHVAEPLLGEQVLRWLISAVGVLGGLYLAFLEPSGAGRFKVIKAVVGLGLVAAAVGFFYLSAPLKAPGHIAWLKFSPQLQQQTLASGRPQVVLFTADWCPPCKRLKAHTLSDTRVVEFMERFTPIKVDLTINVGSEERKLMQAWGVKGVPTTVFVDSAGRRLSELTAVGFRPPDDFLRRMRQALAASPGKDGS